MAPISAPKRMQLGLRSKFTILVNLLLAIIFGIFGYVLINNSTQSLRADLFEESSAFAALATEPIGATFAIYKDSGTGKLEQEIRKTLDLNDSIVNIAVVDVAGSIQYILRPEKNVSVTVEEAASFKPIYKYDEHGVLISIIYPYFEASKAHRYSVVYTITDEHINQKVEQEQMSSIVFAVVALALTGLSVYLLVNRLIIRPIESVSEQAEIISEGNLDHQIAIRSHDEIGTLGDSVNKMAESLKKHIAELKEVDKVKSEFMMITSHNLRTPLTIINGYLENAEHYARNPKILAGIIEKLGASVRRLEAFAEDVLTISRFELGEQDTKREAVEIKKELEHIADEFKASADSKPVDFRTDLRIDGIVVNASAPYLRSALWNLLDNALKFTPEKGTITLRSYLKDSTVCISVEDTGIGISEEELPKLFTKFHRGTSTLTYDYGGTGIGLYASKVMIQNYGGTISATSKAGQGSTFTVTLPIKQENAQQIIEKDKG